MSLAVVGATIIPRAMLIACYASDSTSFGAGGLGGGSACTDLPSGILRRCLTKEGCNTMIRTFASRSVLTVGLAAGLAVGLVGVAGVAGAATHGPKAPGQPTAVVVTPANTALSVSWGVPTTDGGAPIAGYTATATSKGHTTETCTTAGALKCVITGIVNPVGKAKNKYKVAVTATNSVGTGKAGKASGTYTGTTTQNCSYLGEYANLQGCYLVNDNLTGYDLTDANLFGANLRSAVLDGANLSGANMATTYLSGASFIGTNLTNADLAHDPIGGSNLTGANLTGANLSNVALNSSNLTNADLTNANLSGAFLVGVNFTGATVSGVIYTTSTTCPNDINYGTSGANCP